MSQHKTSRRKHSKTEAHIPFKIVGYSIACERHIHRNEDSFIIEKNSGLAAVFDGVGGSAAGEIASRTAARATRQAWREALQEVRKGRNVDSYLENCAITDFCLLLQHLIEKADDLVRTEGARQAGTDDLATTVALAAICRQSAKNEYTMVYAHVGDSRVYLLREHEPLKRLTVDDGLLGRLVENSMVSEEDAHRIDQAMHVEDLSDLEFSYFRLRGGITQALGGPMPPTIHAEQITIIPGDRILLCTDGIHDNLIDAEIEDILRNAPRQTVARRLVEKSLQRSRQERQDTIRAKPDDMTAIVMTCRF
ncbi:MAG TPA: PP2C family serine/threonine-protein phosphatase [Ktedonobacteraceae bacterium]|jgi:serine/threonine protein phosphatase PrpC|nr:PP2C family serine/threonine-protein phosphatase [Ktedonobacteraceae bacterium]